MTDLVPLARKGASASFTIFTLFGDYLIPYNAGQAWTKDLIYLLDILGMPERTARTTLTRMKDRGWFQVEREGRQSKYILTSSGRNVLEQGRQRIFEPATVEWDGNWQIASFSLPESLRVHEEAFRKQLLWFGFGNLAKNIWVSSHDRQAELTAIATELGISNHVALFSGKRAGLMSNEELVSTCWDISTLGEKYAAFVATWQPRYERFVALANQKNSPSPQFRFQESLWLTFDFQPFPRIDPNLPVVLLPSDWQGHQARQIFHHYRQHLRLGLDEFFQEVVG